MTNAQEKILWVVTGEIGTGKTEFSKFLETFKKENGECVEVPVEDSDVYLYDSDIAAKNVWKARRGEKIDGSTLADSNKMKEIENFVHPILLKDIKNIMDNQPKKIIIVESAIYYRIKWDEKLTDNVILIRSSKELQRERLRRKTGWGDITMEQRIYFAARGNEEAKDKAKIIVKNDDGLDFLKEQAREVFLIISRGPMKERIVLEYPSSRRRQLDP